MDKKYYDILQVNRNASPEIIEKAYKTLAKKYHPDLQTEENKKHAEETLKKINEAYEVLSNPDKKKAYDTMLLEEDKKNNHANYQAANDHASINYQQTSADNLRARQQQEILRQQQMAYQQQQREQEIAYQQQIQEARNQAYHDAYIQDLKNRGYKIRYQKTWKDYIKSLISLALTIFILFLLFQIPFIKNSCIQFYEENKIVHILVDFILSLFNW